MNDINNKDIEDFFNKNKWNKRFRFLLSKAITQYFNETTIKDFCNSIQYDLSLITALEYTNYNKLLKYFGDNAQNLEIFNNILYEFIIDENERKKIFDINGEITIYVTNGKLKIKRYHNDDFANIILENNKGISYDIVNSYQGLGYTYNDNYCKQYILYLLGIDRYYEDINYGIMYEIKKIDDNTYEIRINDNKYIENIKNIANQIKPSFTNLHGDIQKDMNYR